MYSDPDPDRHRSMDSGTLFGLVFILIIIAAVAWFFTSCRGNPLVHPHI
jgi:hypothetical protein